MNSKQRRILRYRAQCAAQKIETANYTAKISKAFSKLSGEATGRVAKAMAVSMPRCNDVSESGGSCLRDVSLYYAGHRSSKIITAR